MAGTLAAIFSLPGSKKWIIRDGRNGISRTGVGRPDGQRAEEVLRRAHAVSLVGSEGGLPPGARRRHSRLTLGPHGEKATGQYVCR